MKSAIKVFLLVVLALSTMNCSENAPTAFSYEPHTFQIAIKLPKIADNTYLLNVHMKNDKYYMDYINDNNDTSKAALTYQHMSCSTDIPTQTYNIKWKSNKSFINLFGNEGLFDPAEPNIPDEIIPKEFIVNDNDVVKIRAEVKYRDFVYADSIYIKIKVNK